MRNKFKILPLLLGLIPALSASGAIIVNVGNYTAAAGQTATVQISVTNSTPAATSDVEGMTFTVQIGAGTGAAPLITSVDLLTGTVWAGEASAGDIYTPAGGDELQYQSRDILTDNGGEYINANGLLATVTINTTGAAGGIYPIELVGTETAGDDSAFSDGIGDPVPATFDNGQLTVNVPEPVGIVPPLLGAFLLASRRMRIAR